MRLRFGLMAVFILAGTLSGVLAAGAQAADRPLVVVELFTSQGCASCPPADKFLAHLAQRDDVLALSLHVDYWDYIGWADSFARPEHTSRQRAYSQAAGLRSIYTPQMIIAGSDHIIGFKPMEVADYIEMYHDKPARVLLMVREQAGYLQLEAKPATHAALPAEIMAVLVTFTAVESVKVARGENRGKTLVYANIVTGMTELGSWDGQGVFTLEAPLDSDGPAAVFLQEAGPGEILAAARLR